MEIIGEISSQLILFVIYFTNHILLLFLLGGEHYEGMAELVQKQRSIVDISKMTGRNDNANTNSDIDPFDEKYGIVGQVLELNVVDFKPNMPKSKGFSFSDPVSVPRFADLTIEGSFFTF